MHTVSLEREFRDGHDCPMHAVPRARELQGESQADTPGIAPGMRDPPANASQRGKTLARRWKPPLPQLSALGNLAWQ